MYPLKRPSSSAASSPCSSTGSPPPYSPLSVASASGRSDAGGGAASPFSAGGSNWGAMSPGSCSGADGDCDGGDMATLYLDSDLVEDSLLALDADERKAELASRILENIDELIDLREWIQDDDLIDEEPYNNWLEDQPMLPMPTFGEVEPIPVILPVSAAQNKLESPLFHPQASSKPYYHHSQQPTVADTQFFIREFESVVHDFHQHGGQLTPPQSPPNSAPESVGPASPINVFAYSPSEQQHGLCPKSEVLYMLEHQKQTSAAVRSPITNTHCVVEDVAVARQMEEVEELVRMRVDDLMETTHNGNSSSGVSGDEGCASSVTSFSSSNSSSSSCGDDDPDYPEWAPQYNASESKAGPSKPRKSRAKPYKVRANADEKRYRKKEQNKNAATRYRQKKKAEVDVIVGEEKLLMADNDRLHGKIEDVQREIRYLKGLMRELFKAKGLIN